MASLPDYAELHCLSNFSFLRGASHPDELVAQAAQQGYAALALTTSVRWPASCVPIRRRGRPG